MFAYRRNIGFMTAALALALGGVAGAAVVTQYSFENNLLDTAGSGVATDNLTASTRGGTLSVSYQAGVVGQAVRISNAATQAYVLSAADSNDLDLAGDYTFEAFVHPRPEHTDTWHRVAVKWFGGGTQYHFALEGAGDNLDLHLNGGSTLDKVAAVPAQRWSHVAFTGNSSANTTQLWLNGSAVGTTTYVGIGAGTSPLEFGNTAGSGANAQYSGWVDEVLIHNDAKDATYMLGRAALAPTPPVPGVSLVGHWTFDDNSSTPALLADTSGAGSDNGGIFNSGTTPAQAAGVVGGALELFGNQNIDVGSSVDFDTTTWTASMWLKNDPGITGWRTAFGSWSPQAFHIGKNSGANWGDHGGGQTSGGSVVDNTWYHIVSRRTPNGQENSLWINGVKQAQTSTGAPAVPGAALVYLGSRDASANRWDGKIDDLGYWNEALTDAEVRALFNLGLPTSLGSAFGYNYNQAEVEQLFLAHDNLGDTTIGGTPWQYADNLNAIAGGAAEGDLFTSGGIDYLLLNSSGNGTGLAQIPEPSAFALAATGLLGLLGWGRRRRR